MQPDISSVDELYLKAEELSQDFSLFPRKEPASFVKGLLTESQIDSALDGLRGMEVDSILLQQLRLPKIQNARAVNRSLKR